MYKTPVSIAFACFAIAMLASPAGATPVGQVVQACDNMHNAGQTCNYGIKGNALVGCTNTTVFVCPATAAGDAPAKKNTSGRCNEDGTAARRLPKPQIRTMRGDDLLQSMQMR